MIEWMKGVRRRWCWTHWITLFCVFVAFGGSAVVNGVGVGVLAAIWFVLGVAHGRRDLAVELAREQAEEGA